MENNKISDFKTAAALIRTFGKFKKCYNSDIGIGTATNPLRAYVAGK